MKKLLLLSALLFALPLVTSAVQITVPSAPGSGYALVSTTTGNYVATSTDPFHVGSLYATSTATSTFNGGINLLKGCYAVGGTCITGGGGGSQTPWTSDIDGAGHSLNNTFGVETGFLFNSSSVGSDITIQPAGQLTVTGGTVFNVSGMPSGFGTNIPHSTVELDTLSSATKGLIIEGQTGQSADLMEVDNPSAAVLDVIDPNGKFGIGTTTPFASLSVSTTTATNAALPLFTVASSTNKTIFQVNNNGQSFFGTNKTLFSTPAEVTIDSGAVQAPLLFSSDNISATDLRMHNTSSNQTWDIDVNGSINPFGANNFLLGNGSAAVLALTPSGVMTLFGYGGGGTKALEVDNSGQVNAVAPVTQYWQELNPFSATYAYMQPLNADRLVVDPTGIITDDTSSMLQVGGNGYVTGNFNANTANFTGGMTAGGSNFTIDGSGNVSTTGTLGAGGTTLGSLTVGGLSGGGTQCVQIDNSGVFSGTGSACGSGSGAVNSVSNSDGSLTITPTTGNVVSSINLAHSNTFTANQAITASTNGDVDFSVTNNSSGAFADNVISTINNLGNENEFVMNSSGYTPVGLLLPDQGALISTGSNGFLLQTASAPIKFAEQGSGGGIEQIFKSGNAGFGTTSPWTTLSVKGSSDLGNSALAGFFTGTTTATSTLTGGLTTNLLNVTSSTASSTFNNGINLNNGCFAIKGTCLSSGGSGTVTSIATNNGLTGGTITTSGTIGLNITGLSTNALVTWNGSNLVATGTQILTAGSYIGTTTATSTLTGGLAANILNTTSTTASSTFANGINTNTGCYAIAGKCTQGAITLTTSGSSGAATFNGVTLNIPNYAAGTNYWTSSGGNIYNNTGTNVGIGSTSPFSTLAVEPVTGGAPTNSLFIVASSSNANILSVLANGEVMTSAAQPTLLSRTTTGVSNPYAVAVAGRYVYVANSANSTLETFDYSKPTSPAKISALTITSGGPVDLALSGRYVYIADESLGLDVVDVSNPATPVLASTTSDGLNTAFDVAVSGHYAYVVSQGNNSIVTFDVSNPAAPKKVSSVGTGLSTPQHIVVQGRYAYVTSYSNGQLVVFDISNPTTPLETASVGTGLQQPYALTVSGRYAYIGETGLNAVVTYDISNPNAPTEVNSLSGGSLNDPFALTAQGRYLYVDSIVNSNIIVYDIANPASPLEISHVTLPTSGVYGMAVAGRYAYLADEGGGSVMNLDLGGNDVNAESVGSLEAGTLQTRNDITDNGNLNVLGGIGVGTGGIMSNGPISAGIASTTQTNPISGYFQGFVGLATTTPDSNLDVNGSVRLEGSSTAVTASIGGSIIGLGCDSGDTFVGGGLSSTTAFVTTPQSYPGDGLNWFSYALNSTTIRTKVCSDVTVTPNSSLYNVKILK